ncbi:helix-turn-helix transcriptional regulator [Bacillus sp. IB182487]|uniref:Helix-turn-helix transcriptional regulator n=1 Tax=Metabacillus arenae TaxID=2771434 RepID=A0A926NER2_9BACI|nr:helix-turn-helix transcriptional regulator [Metabacillus arenae]
MRIEIGQCLLEDLIHRKGMTQQQLADMTGISKSQISEYRRNKRKMSLHNAMLIAVALNCHIDDLYEWKVSR